MKSFLSRWLRPAPRVPRKPLRWRPRLEELESRSLLSVSVSFSGNQLVVTGDNSGNDIRVDVVGSGEFARQRISYYAGGGYVVVGEYGGFSSILINSGGGNDEVRIQAVLYPGDPITINGNAGYDFVDLSSMPRQAPVNVNNTLGYTYLSVNDPNPTSNATLTVGQSSLTLAHPEATYVVNYTQADLRELSVALGSAGHNVVVNDTPNSGYASMRTVISMGGAGVAGTVNVKGTSGPLWIESIANETVYVGNAGHLTNILGAITVSNNTSNNQTVIVDDSQDPTPRTANLDTVSFLGDAYGRISFGGAPIIYQYSGTNTANLNTGNGCTVNVLATGVPTIVTADGANTTVHIGNAGHLTDIRAPITIDGTPNSTAVTVDDSADTTYQTSVNLDTVSMGFRVYGRIAFGVGGVPIEYWNDATSSATLHTGVAGANVNVPANGKPTYLVGHGPSTTFNVGNAGHLTNILAPITIDGTSPSSIAVNVDDSNDTTNQPSVTLDDVVMDFRLYGRISFGGGVPIQYHFANGGTNVATVYTGVGGATANVLVTLAPTQVVGYGPLTVNVGSAGHVQEILGNLTISDPGNQTLSVNVNDQNDSADRLTTILDTVNQGINFIRLRNLAPATIYSVASQTSQFVVNGGTGQNTWSVEGTAAGVNIAIYGGLGYNQFGAGDGNGNALFGPLAFHGRPGSFLSFMDYFDYIRPTAQTYTLTSNTISRPGLAPVTFDNLVETIFTPAHVGGNTINLQSVAAGVTAILVTGNGDSVTIGTNQSLAAVQGSVVVGPLFDNTSANVVIDDSANATGPPITLGNNVTYGFTISGLTPPAIYLDAGQNTIYNTSLHLGGGDKTVNVQAAAQGVALNLNAGSGTNTLDYTPYAGNVLVNLNPSIHAATGFSSISNIQNVTGASGGPAGSYNILVGNGGNVLTGGNGRRNLLIAGNNGVTGSTLIGGDGEDILIGGTTLYDTEPGMVSLQAIMAYWAGTDDYDTRVANLTSGAGVPLLDASTVTGNQLGNTLTGNAGRDLFFGDLALDTYDWDPATETFISV
jgi:hypothetical protein